MLLRLWFNYTYILILVNKKVNIINFLSVKIARPVIYYFFPINCKKSSGEREKEKLWGESALVGKAHRKNGGPQTESTQQKTARPHARSSSRTPSAPRRERGKATGEHHHRHTQADREGGGGPRTGPEATKAGRGKGGGHQTGGTRGGGENHQPGAGAARCHRAHQRDRAGGERGAGGAAHRENRRARRGGAHERISTTGATHRHRATACQDSAGNARHQRAERGRQPAPTRKTHHRRSGGGGQRERGHYAPHRAAKRAARRRDARPRPTGAGGGATGTETAQPPGTARTAQKRTRPPAATKRRAQERENRPAAAGEENRTTATNPEKARPEGRNETPRAEPAHGANAQRADRTTEEGTGAKANEEAATGHPTNTRKPPRTGPAENRPASTD